MNKIYIVVGLFFSVYMVFTWVSTSMTGYQGSTLWYLRALMAVVGIIAMVAYIWYQLKVLMPRRKKKEAAESGGAEQGSGADDVDLLVRDAESRLATSELGKKAKLANVPVLLIVGRDGSAKTSTTVNSGLSPDLLAGHVYRENTVIPTAAANVWYAQRSGFVEAGGKLLARADSWGRLLKKLRPGGLSSVFGAKQDAPRAALVCISCEEFLKPGAGESLAVLARELRGKLEEASQSLGIRLPVYVLFTKTDRIAYFAEYARNLSNEEVAEVVGMTLPADGEEESGIYSERQSQHLTRAFNNLVYSLSDYRPSLLTREGDEKSLPGVYEFPRELRKLRPNLVQLLVDLCRPSQLRAGPFLRGFYFSGVRAVLVREAPSMKPRGADRGERDISAATMVFTDERARAAMSTEGQGPVTRKKPQWVFLSHLFHKVLLGDALAGLSGGASLKTNRLRRILLATAAMLCFIWSVGMVVSYFGNRGLESETIEAVSGIGAAEAAGGEAASLDALNRLESVRQALETLTRYEVDGAPWRLRWGLYIGDDLYPKVRRAYYSRFHQLLFAQTQSSLIATLQRLPDKPAPTDVYSPVYDALKAYLITTSHPDRSTRDFLPPVLMDHWMRNRGVEEERVAVAQLQFDFYADDLPNSNPFSAENDTLAIERGRRYLSQFAGVERAYQFMIAEASRQNPSVNFNRLFPGSERVVVNNREVPGAFSKDGWAFMQDAVKRADRFFGGEEWVLGSQSAAGIDAAALEKELAARYRADFINQWMSYLRDTTVVRYGSLSDAAGKLSVVSGNESPLLAALWLASRNTNVESEDITKLFQPVQFVVPPENEDRYIGESNSRYMQSLLGLQTSVEQAAAAPTGQRDFIVEQVNGQASQAKIVTREVAQNFNIDAETKIQTTVQQLMEKPILYAEALVRSLGPAELNAGGRALCAQFRDLMQKYPFKQDATAEATLGEVAAIFQPGTGALWAFYEQDLREHLVVQGQSYGPAPGSKIRLNPAFVSFFNRAAGFANAIYPGGARAPNLTYKLTGHPAEGIRRVSLKVESQVLTVGRQPESHVFVWPGSGNQQVVFTGQFGGGPDLAFASYDGLWGVFRFFGDADRWQDTGAAHRLEWVLRQGRAGRPLTLPDGRPLTVRFDLEGAPVFRKDFLAGLACVSTVAR